MSVKELKEVLAELPDDMPVNVIFNGMVDETPDYNVDDDCLYIEGAGEEWRP